MIEQDILERIYAAFNARDIDAVLAAMHPDVDWPNGMEGGYMKGRDAVRAYWTRQWEVIDPTVVPVGYATDDDGGIIVDVHQIVRDPAGAVLVDQLIRHVYRVEDGLITHMEIRSF